MEESQMKNDPNRMTAGELSLVLNVTEATVKRLAKTEQIPSFRIGAQVVFEFEKVLQHLRKLEGAAA
jgi:excisionase family DNA binding protein